MGMSTGMGLSLCSEEIAFPFPFPFLFPLSLGRRSSRQPVIHRFQVFKAFRAFNKFFFWIIYCVNISFAPFVPCICLVRVPCPVFRVLCFVSTSTSTSITTYPRTEFIFVLDGPIFHFFILHSVLLIFSDIFTSTSPLTDSDPDRDRYRPGNVV